MRVPWTARRSNQSMLKEINPEYSLEGLMLKLKLQYTEKSDNPRPGLEVVPPVLAGGFLITGLLGKPYPFTK